MIRVSRRLPSPGRSVQARPWLPELARTSRKPGAWFEGPATLDHDLPACTGTAPSEERQSSEPYSRFRDHASEPVDEGRFELSNSFDRQSHLRYVLAAGWSFWISGGGLSSEPQFHSRTT